MNKKRVVLAGSLLWILIVISFSILAYVPSINKSLNQQALLVSILIIPFAFLSAWFYYKNGNKEHGLFIGLCMSLTALCLDALITVPFIEMPKGGSYKSFYLFPLLWLMVATSITSVYLYWKLKIKPIMSEANVA